MRAIAGQSTSSAAQRSCASRSGLAMTVLYARRVLRTMIVGHGGRESALALRMAEHSRVHAFMGHANPTIVRHVQASRGSQAIRYVCDPRAVAAFDTAPQVDLPDVSPSD